MCWSRGELQLRVDGSVHEARVRCVGLSCLDARNASCNAEVVGSKDGFWLSGAILLGMALVVGIAQPFERPQVNALQTSCFACASGSTPSAQQLKVLSPLSIRKIVQQRFEGLMQSMWYFGR